MKIFVLIVIISSLTFSMALCQETDSLKATILCQEGGTRSDSGYGVVVDTSKNIYVTGLFKDTITIGKQTITCSGNACLFVSKYDLDGQNLWVRSSDGLKSTIALDIGVDGHSNIYVSGYYSGKSILGKDTIECKYQEGFLAKFDSLGNVLWLKTINSDHETKVSSIAVDQMGNIHVTGSFHSTANFEGNIIESKAISKSSEFIAKYNTSGDIIWVKSIGGGYSSKTNAIAVDLNGNVYITGHFRGKHEHLFDGQLNGDDVSRLFLAKYDSLGTMLWVRNAGSTNKIDVKDVSTDREGNVFVTGGFNGTVGFGNNNVTNRSPFDIFVTKYDKSGTNLWVRTGNGASNGGGLGESISTDGNGNIYVTGKYSAGYIEFGNNRISCNKYDDGFMVGFNNSGDLLHLVSIGNKSGGKDITTGPDGNVFVTGWYAGSNCFTGFKNVTLNSGESDIFVIKYEYHKNER
jgi:hypothetical protein